MRIFRFLNLALAGALALSAGACGAQVTPAVELPLLPTRAPTPFFDPGAANPTASEIAVQGQVEDLVIEASVKVALCLTDPDSCAPYSLDVEGECARDPHNDAACCSAVASLKIKPDTYTAGFEELREQFSSYEERNGRRPQLPGDLEWLVKVDEQILEDLFEEWFGPDFTAPSEAWIACQANNTREQIDGMFEDRVRAQFGELFRQCLLRPDCFPLTPAMLNPGSGFLPLLPGGAEGVGLQRWATPGPETPFGTDCGWIIGTGIAQAACPQPWLLP